MIRKYWFYGSFKDIEEIHFDVQEQYVVVSFMAEAEFQNGIILVWDTVSEKIVHVSYGAFVKKAFVYKGYVYSVRDIMASGIKPHLEFYKIPFGVMAEEANGERVAKDANITADDEKHYVLEKRNGKLVAGYKDNVVVIA